jgi:hypothetical protein
MLRKACCLFAFVVVAVSGSHAQHDLDTTNGTMIACSAGLGVTLVRAAYVADYVNSVSTSPTRANDFGVASEFVGALEFKLAKPWGVKLEYSYLLHSQPVQEGGVGDYTLSYGIHLPEVMAQYLIFGKGYAFKIGGGIGYHIAKVSEDYASLGTIDYRSTGIGIKAEAEANTEFDEHFFGVISGDVRTEYMSELKDAAGKPLMMRGTGKHVTMNFQSLGLKFGIMYYL